MVFFGQNHEKNVQKVKFFLKLKKHENVQKQAKNARKHHFWKKFFWNHRTKKLWHLLQKNIFCPVFRVLNQKNRKKKIVFFFAKKFLNEKKGQKWPFFGLFWGKNAFFEKKKWQKSAKMCKKCFLVFFCVFLCFLAFFGHFHIFQKNPL